MHASALGEAVGLLVVKGATASVWAISTAVLLLFCVVLSTVWYILHTYVASRGEFGLHYFVGAADTGAHESTWGTQVQLLCDVVKILMAMQCPVCVCILSRCNRAMCTVVTHEHGCTHALNFERILPCSICPGSFMHVSS